MKKIVSAIIAATLLACVILPEQKAEAQVLYSNRCCDSNLIIRCIIAPAAPVGYPCWCFNQGAGTTC